jgi:hypothetical protein
LKGILGYSILYFKFTSEADRNCLFFFPFSVLVASDVNLKYNIEYPKIPFKWPYCIWKKNHVQYRGMIVLRVSIIAI